MMQKIQQFNRKQRRVLTGFQGWMGRAARTMGATVVMGVGITGALVAQEGAGVDDGFPFLTACITSPFPQGNTANKGVVIRLDHQAAVCFDTDLLRISAGWIGPADWQERQTKVNRELVTSFPGWSEKVLRLNGVTFDGGHGGHPRISGDQVFGTPSLPGWSGADGHFDDPRSEPYGPIPESQGRYNGLYVVGADVVLSYSVHGTPVLEQPGAVEFFGEIGFTRTLKVGTFPRNVSMMVAETEAGSVSQSGQVIRIAHESGQVTYIGAVGLPDWASLKAYQGRVTLQLPQGSPESTFKIVIWRGSLADSAKFQGLLKGTPHLVDFTAGGGSHWPQAVVTQGALETSATPDGAYVVDRLTPPTENPWNRRVRFGGLGFFSDGKSAALSTWDGDVWIVSGIDATLQNLTWKRFASGGFETLGLVVKDDVVYTTGRDQITRYFDINGDGEADYYENFNNQVTSSPGFHEFQFDLHVDDKGNFYTAKAGPVRGGGRGFGGGGGNGEVTSSAGTVQRISPDGRTREVVATGFRAPNGIGVSPDGQITTGDNEGTWVAACPVNWVKPGGFYGVIDTAHREVVPAPDKPLLWLSHREFDNSGGGQVWVTSERWGPFSGELLHMSYGRCALYLVMKDEVGNLMQGGVVRIPLRFTSSAMRARFNPADGQLYIAGLRGWQTDAANITGLDRVRYTGKTVYSVAGLKVNQEGIHLTFTEPLDREEATDVENYSAQQWNYATKYGSDRVVDGHLVASQNREINYGGHDVSVDDPTKVGRESASITRATLSDDGKTVTLQVANLKPVMQFLLEYNLRTADGKRLKQEILQTIHQIPAE